MNKAALECLEQDNSLVSFSGVDVVRGVKVGALVEAARKAISGVYTFAKGGSRSIEGTPVVSSSDVKPTRVRQDVRNMQLGLLPLSIAAAKFKIRDLEMERDKAHRQQD